jgi:tetratricopeptide (TPR) repeat protein
VKKLLPLLLVLASCSSHQIQQPSRYVAAETTKEEDFSWVEKLDFDKKTEAKYSADKDEFNVSGGEENSHALVKESLSVLSGARLDETLTKTDDPIVKMNVKCLQSKFDEALKLADDLYTQYKSNTSYWNQLGSCYYLKNDYAKAILFYNKSRDLDPKFVPPVNNLGVVYQKQGKFQKALAAYKLAADLNAFTVTPTYNLAQLYLKFGTVGKALPIFQGLFKRSPDDMDVASSLASSLLIRGDYQAAADLYGKMDKGLLAKPGIGLNYSVVLKLLNRPMDAKTVLDNVTAVSNEGRDLKEYAQRVDKFIRN